MAPTSMTADPVSIEGGEFTMGSENFYPEERPTRRVRVERFSIDRYAVTNAQFARFIDENFLALPKRLCGQESTKLKPSLRRFLSA